ncbi:MAG: hypothetical protein DWQ19_11295 [Crenarchaeota archaeon]|nr:MAG: hypothetical protein DWQ19_11295 [Thermoproteota archaeon]
MAGYANWQQQLISKVSECGFDSHPGYLQQEIKMEPNIPIMSVEQLQKMATNRLYVIFRMVTAHLDNIYSHYGWRCCEMCLEYVGDNWEEDVGQYARPVKEYRDRIKTILDSREDLKKKPKWRRHKKVFRGRKDKGW